MKKSLALVASFLLLLLFIYGVGFNTIEPNVFFPSLRLLEDTQLDFRLFWTLSAEKTATLLLLIPIGFGLLGWVRILEGFFFIRTQNKIGKFLSFALALSLFSFFIFGLAINEVLNGFLVFLFFAPVLRVGWVEQKELMPTLRKITKKKGIWFFSLPFLLWFFEYWSPPIIWDAVLDHFRYAREVARLHQIPLHWTNHTGDMPKAAEMILAGFWSLGGESLSKLSGLLAVLGVVWLFHLFLNDRDEKISITSLIFFTCPFFMAIFAWGYVEGVLAFFELTAFYCFWKGWGQVQNFAWFSMGAFFLGFAFAIKYTAVLAILPIVFLWAFVRFFLKTELKVKWGLLLFFIIPVFPWLLKNWVAFNNPLYPLATSIFGTSFGYGRGMERELWQDTGLPEGWGVLSRLDLFWKVFFTPQNAVAACWTPLVFMSLPWWWKAFKSRLGTFLIIFSIVFFAGWFFFCTSLRHASGGTLALVLLSAMAWKIVFKEMGLKPKLLFGLGTVLSLWLCLSTQLTTTAPYASALGLEDPLLRLKRHYTYDTDTYAAYRFIDGHSDPQDKVMAFAVFQTYPLERTAFVDFKWKSPILLEWASQCRTAEELASKFREEGVSYFLYQKWEAKAMSHIEKGFELKGMSLSEYKRFWEFFMEPLQYENVSDGADENCTVYKVRTSPLSNPRKLNGMPGLERKEPVAD